MADWLETNRDCPCSVVESFKRPVPLFPAQGQIHTLSSSVLYIRNATIGAPWLDNPRIRDARARAVASSPRRARR